MDDYLTREKIQPSNIGRVALSKQACRFELPLDLRDLESLNAAQYLRKYCVISAKRKILFDRIFERFKGSGNAGMKLSDIPAALKEIFPFTLRSAEYDDLIDTLEVQKEGTIDSKLFNGLCAYVERILYSRFSVEDFHHVQSSGLEDRLEGADFCGLRSKFKDISVNPKISHLLRCLGAHL